MNEAEQLRERALRECFRLAASSAPGFPEAPLAVRAVSEAQVEEAQAEALRATSGRGPWAYGRAFAARLVTASIVDPSTVDEREPSPFLPVERAGYLDERAVDALLAVYTRHVAALAGGSSHGS